MKIAILGYGMEGEASYEYWSANPDNEITIFDQKSLSHKLPKEVKAITGKGYLDNLNGYDLVIRTSGLDKNLIHTDGKIWTVTNEFFDKCPAEIVGVTGTKGKGTISSMIDALLRAGGKTTWLTGNIGDVALKDLPKIKPTDIVIDELSSFQLWDIIKSPHVAVVNLIEPEHLDVHVDFNDYVTAKSNIRKFQGDNDICFYHPYNKISEQIANCSERGKIIKFGSPSDGGVYVKNGHFCIGEQNICSIKALNLVGQHNIENACAAISVAKYYGVNDKGIEAGLKAFRGLPHRIEFVREVNSVRYYNDSFSSSTPATVAAINSFTQPKILIIGGVDRGGDFSHVAELIVSSNIKAVVVIGEIRKKLANIINSAKPSAQIIVTDFQTMPEILNLANSFSKPGDVVLLSPGCGSFDMFKDFIDRGNQFKDEVSKL